ncbi:MAG: ATP synthase F1 subunit delta [Nitrospira sp.]|nr:ATP synthase F1 subunit delta [Nitrospira sp.]
MAQLVRKNRAGFLPEIAEAFARLVDQSKGTQPVTVFSSTALSAAEQQQMKKRLSDTLKRDVDITFQTDASYLAGVRIQIGSAVVDSTVRGRLKDIESLLTHE